MSSSCDTLYFSLPAHGNSVLHKMNALREDHRFCDITLVLGSPNTSVDQSVHFHGHRVVLAASSDFFRDQFLLHEDQAEMSVAAVSSTRVAKTLLLSCYTGLLEVPLAELVSYLSAASILQMSEVVEKCSQAVLQFLKPIMFSNKPASCSKETENQQPERSWLCSSFENRREKDVAQPSTSIQEVKTKEEGVAIGQAMDGVSQESKVDNEKTNVTTEDMKFVKPKLESTEDQKFELDTLKSEQGVKNPTAALKDEVYRDLISFRALEIRSAADHGKLVDISQKQHEQVGHEEKQDNSHKAQLEHGGVLIDSKISNLPEAHSTKPGEDVLLEASHSVLVERPYLCRKCDKIFQHLENYMGHLKEHRQYSCLVCGEGFSQKSKLTRHIRVHPDVKPFRCPLCHETFIQKGWLQEHLNLHTGHKRSLNPTNKSDFTGLKGEKNGSTDVLEKAGGAS
ncbi:zinc finger and BTB domain-containing protein 26 [Poecilia formosa]|uniref:Zinc finger and BTB domain-containing protein 26 n=1 Tax=Poecilia formosa TaxID=48698 RepID=A0A087YP73_POEFO|nr:PREDICTED: zinc finger and BTB domain-containing protein 26 [Poecilia formosa]XP_016534576.1 PREDICTED: zinc finger and BTB domain-containing protein 26 [Poecilia formosa]XP_016534579.1 PREDICTED: zinc finger and BTB domain-containing protein 26 [Poecilia formosa]XP_016534583.1 PREDICTED: zinc finger and BTB domain-containing protein 26 [Poecilia formosa]